MNKQLRRNCVILVVASILLFLFLGKSTTTVKANPSISDVLKATPSGMDLEDYFEAPTKYTGNSTVPNSLKIIKKGQAGNKSDVVQMTDKTNQLASIWGKMATADAPDTPYNYFDVTKEQNFSAWMYFGDDFTRSGDGMAFVIQNDPNGIDAISKKLTALGGSYPQTGETIGVWGGFGSPTAQKMADGAIKNSFALEFDTHHNDTNMTWQGFIWQQGDFFDGLKSGKDFVNKGQHIAWSYPNQASAYHEGQNVWTNYFDLVHHDVINNLVLSGNDKIKEVWHHFTFKYMPPSGDSTIAHISYVFDDKDYDGSIRKYRYWDKRPRKKGDHIDIDTKYFHLKPGQKRIRWGFTSATGSPGTKDTNNAIVLESIPAVADIKTSSSLYDFTQEREILDHDQNQQADVNVNNGDKLEFDYLLNYNSGLAETGPITTKMNLPDYVDFKPKADGVIGKVICNDKTIDLTQDELGEELDDQGKTVKFLNFKLDSLGYDNNNVRIKLFGNADIGSDVSSKVTNVQQAHTSFSSPHYKGDLMSPQFSINPVEDTLTAAATSAKVVKVQHSQKFEMNGKIEYAKGSKFDNNKLSLHTVVDQGTPNVTELPITQDSQQKHYSIMMKASSLSLGRHTITVYVSDAKHRFSNKVDYEVIVDKDTTVLNLQSDPSYSFQDVNQTYAPQLIHRKGKWNLKVESLNSIWSLKVRASSLINSKSKLPLAGGLIYRDGNTEVPLNSEPVLLGEDNTLSNQDRIFDIAGNWLQDSGILLKVRSDATGGSYEGTISWTLTNSIDS
ncbi:lectin-like domain-containing protein [Companilactobacillus sp. HBUAS59699]|uniref:lectin-like domain-containing protein n=1 Tax=Companilactobacillus sp. HBUAS59699 TaxID=3109358 RepID=UPI002FEFAE53